MVTGSVMPIFSGPVFVNLALTLPLFGGDIL